MMNLLIYIQCFFKKDCILSKGRFHFIILLHEILVYFHIPFPRTAPNNKIIVVDQAKYTRLHLAYIFLQMA